MSDQRLHESISVCVSWCSKRCSVACVSTGQGECAPAVWQHCAPGSSYSGLMPIVWEWLGTVDHTRRARGNADLHRSAGERSRRESTEFLAGIIFLLLSVSFRSPSSSTMHTHTHTLSPFVSLHSQSSCSLFHFSFTLWKPLSCTQAFAFLRSRWNNISVTTALTCPAEYVRTRVCASTNTSECMFVVFCGRSKAQCGWTLREGYEEDNNSSKKHRHWLQLAELTLCEAAF